MSLYYQDEHVTLYHGDCLTEHREWLDADILVTDPPYGIPGGRVGRHDRGGVQTHADADWDNLETRNEVLAAWGDTSPRLVFGTPKDTEPPRYRGVPVVWDKGNSPGMGDHTWPFGANYELIWILGDGWAGKRINSVIRVTNPSNAAATIGHPTPKPLQLMELLISYSPPGVIADPFAGSGATLEAARNLGRKAIGVELEEKYCEIIAKRLDQQVIDFEALM